MFNKYLVAAAVGLAAVSFYVFLSSSRPGSQNLDSFAAATVAVATFGAVICLILSIEIGTYSELDLGKLRDERSALIGGLLFSSVLGAGSVTERFNELSRAPPDASPPTWIYRAWGSGGNCSTPITIYRGNDESVLIFEIAGERHPHRIVGRPTENSVETDQGTYTVHPDGSMTTTEQGMEGIRLTPCAP